MKKYFYQKLTPRQLRNLCRRPSLASTTVLPIAETICAEVKRLGDRAIRFYAKKFDGRSLQNLRISKGENAGVGERIPRALKTAIATAYANIEKFHAAELPVSKRITTMPGVTCWKEIRPIERVGLYIPGGTAPLPSTVLMLGIPARLAGCREIIICTPPGKSGTVSDVILYAAKRCGIEMIFKVGGAQAIAAMAYGTETIPKVDKIFGPGNQFVTAAKQLVSIDPDGAVIDLPAGPSEVMVIADRTARPDFVAADLLSQAEHGPDSQVVLVTTEETVVNQVFIKMKEQISTLPRRAIAKRVLAKSFVLIVRTVADALQFANQYAPEHLILSVQQLERWSKLVQNAGSVFLGPYTPESAGDYASGTNHTLPTAGYARAYSGVSVGSFTKCVTFQMISRAGAKRLGPTVSMLAQAEGLTAHQRAMEIRYS